MEFDSLDTRVYDALATLRNLSDEFASFEVRAGDKKKKKLYTECRKHITKVVEELESSVTSNSSHGGLNMGVYTGGSINTTTSEENRHIPDVRSPQNTDLPGVGTTYESSRKKH